MLEESPEEKATREAADRAVAEEAKFIRFLDHLERLAEEDKLLAAGETAQFVGYPFWMRLVYCSTRPLSVLLKETQNFQSLPAPAVLLEIHKHIREILEDESFCAFVQAHSSKRERRNWLEHLSRKSTKSGCTFVTFAGRLTRLPHD